VTRLANLIRNFKPGSLQIQKPLVIAEAGVNHEGSIELARRLIDEAVEGGAQAIKFQTYKAETLAVKQSPVYWDTTLEPTPSQFELFKKYDKFWKKEFEQLKTYCDKAGIEFLSTPFDAESASFLNDLMEVYKISSSDLNNFPFIRLIAGFKKPILLSTGGADLGEIEQTVSFIKDFGNPLSLMHCVLNYPTAHDHANLGMIVGLKKSFPNLLIGYSDHTLPDNMDILITATLLGSGIIEKHFTFDKNLPGNDHYHAMDKEDLKRFWVRLADILDTLGSYEVIALPEEEKARLNARRSLVSKETIKAGEEVKASQITWKRPGTGISPKDLEKLTGKRAKVEIPEDSILHWEMFE